MSLPIASPGDAADRLAARLREAGVPEAEIAEARHGGGLGMLALDRLLLPGPPAYDEEELARRAGVPVAFARRLWRALGFPDVAPGEKRFSDADVEMLARVRTYVELGIADERAVLQLTRVVGSAMARVAEAQTWLLQERFAEAGLAGDEAAEFALELATVMRSEWERVLPYVHLRQLQAAAKRAAFLQGQVDGATVPVTVGFADLVGFTALSRRLDSRSLADLVDQFEDLAHDTVSGCGGRVVKMIGDEVMFVTDEPVPAVEIGLVLTEAHRRDRARPDVRVGVAGGAAVAHAGDYFGPVVNLASRIVEIAHAGTVVVDDTVRAALQGDARFAWRPIRPRRLKGIGTVRLWVVTANSGR